MKKMLMVLATLSVLVVGCCLPPPVGAQKKSPKGVVEPRNAEETARAVEVIKGLRSKLLTAAPEDILDGEDAKAKVFGVLMEFGLSAGVATVVSLRDGTSSLYVNTGSAVLGGYSAREQARHFVVEAEKHLARMKPTKEFPYPTAGRMKFYVMTRDGVYTADVDEEGLVSGRHALSPLFRAGNDVLTELRIGTERAKP